MICPLLDDISRFESALIVLDDRYGGDDLHDLLELDTVGFEIDWDGMRAGELETVVFGGVVTRGDHTSEIDLSKA